MNKPVKQGVGALTEKEKQTLRLIVRGHDAKSLARNLGLSVHTVNERLRDARRKMAVSSSREAARLLLDAEGGNDSMTAPNLVGDKAIGEDAARASQDQGATPPAGVGQAYRRPWIIGVSLMTFALGLLALAALSQAPSSSTSTVHAVAASDPTVVDTAVQWLALLDQARWDDSYRATGSAFRKLNTAQVWAAASERARGPLGKVMSRTFVSQEYMPAPPQGYEVTKFRTRFSKAEVVETVTLEREDGSWRVVGVIIE